MGAEIKQKDLQAALPQEEAVETTTLGVKAGLSSSWEYRALWVMQNQALP